MGEGGGFRKRDATTGRFVEGWTHPKGLSMLARCVINTGESGYQAIADELYEQGIDVSEQAVRKAMRQVAERG